MPPVIEQIVARIHDSPLRVVFSVTGGGATAIGRLLDVPGASRTVLEAVIPYSPRALAEWLGGPADQACSAQTARSMAMAGFRRARLLSESGATVAGVACTASLATDRPKRGDHRAHLALQTEARTATWSLRLEKGRRSRAEEEKLVGSLLLNVVAGASGVEARLPLDLLPGEDVERSQVVAPRPWQDLLTGRAAAIRHGGPADRGEATVRAVFPGAFNPLHAGHRRMAEIAAERLGVPVDFELSILNVDKPPLDYFQIERRLGRFDASQAVWLTRSATFEEKSRQFPGATFVVGVDTLRRIAEPRYYGGDRAACDAAITSIAARGCRFLVFARADSGVLTTLADLDVPEVLESICREVPPEQFREDVSSTEIRGSTGG